ncbi:MAG TPA: (2Fe-2S)-binding protein [Thermomicrobiales bacterium]|nr:(2Fe-2S)-binding protein [Thermomicrobiales bacterium]
MPTTDALDSPDMLVIGLGTAGRAVLDAAYAVGVQAIGVDQSRLSTDVSPNLAFDVTRAWGVFSDGTVVLAGPTVRWPCKPKAIVVATGSLDLPLPMPGWELDGVTGAHHARERLPDGARVVVIRGPHAGLGNRQPDLSMFQVIADRDVAGDAPVTIIGDGHVEAVVIGDDQLETSYVLLDNGLQPENILARMAGVPNLFSAAAGGDVIVPGAVFATGGALLSLVGDAAGIHSDRERVVRDAAETGQVLAESVLTGHIPVSTISERFAWPAGGAPVLPSQATFDTLVCPSEGVTVGMVREAIARGAITVNDVKRRTRAAMATCQGRDCLWTTRAMLAEANRNWETPMTARPPAVGITLQELAGIAGD